ncbi:MAG: peptidylprolyl isomerase [Sphingobacteriales bacterium]|nr:peptidylprolyl isomerase [Sphingobacteriales bacterium]
MKKLLFTLSVVCFLFAAKAQTIFSYGPYKVSKEEFLRAFNKNNQGAENKEKAIKEYLDLYSKFKLKVQAAKAMRLDTLPNQKSDLLSYETQLQDTYMSGENFMNDLVTEAFERSKTDEEIAHLFIPILDKNDTTLAKQKADKAYTDLKNGLPFEKAVDKYVSLTEYKANKGYIGFITVFSLPYTLETLIYKLPAGGFSAIYKSKAGYHIFKKISERPAVGSLKVAQLLLAYPEGVTEEEKTQKRILADSLYKALVQGASFNDMVKQFSEDKFTYQNNGEMPFVTLGKYDSKFENAAYSIEKENGYSVPVETATGIHIIKLLKKIPVSTDDKNPDVVASMQQQVRVSDRMMVAQNKQQQEILKQVQYKKIPFDEKSLWKISDSALRSSNYQQYFKSIKKTPLFSFTKQIFYSTDWVIFIKGRSMGDNNRNTPEYFKKEMEEYVKFASQEYYKKHLDEYKPDYNFQIQEFKEGNLLFEIMERNVWSKAGADSVGLKKYYDQHKEKYKWEPSVDAIIITCADEASTQAAMKKIKADPSSWKKMAEEFEGKVQADSGRFEMGQIPVVERTNFEKGLVTLPLKNEQDGSAVFSYIAAVYHETAQRSFEEARGLVINDYQLVLEEKWIEQLKKKYPVKTDEKVLKSLF